MKNGRWNPWMVGSLALCVVGTFVLVASGQLILGASAAAVTAMFGSKSRR